MKKIDLGDIKKYVNKNIAKFHNNKLESLRKLKLNEILKRKNPYLFKAKNILSAQDLVKTILDAYLSSQEETIFGDFLEGLALFINNKIYKGNKSSAEGIDLEFEKEGIKYIVSIKSGPSWGNSSQIKKMIDNFKKAKKILRLNNPGLNIIAVNGCCYGQGKNYDKGDYFKYCGQKFWEFLSGNKNLYIDIIEPLGFEAKKRNEEFMEEYYKLINNFTADFLNNFCIKGRIEWDKLVKFNSGYE